MLRWRHHIMSLRCIFGNLREPFFEYENAIFIGEQVRYKYPSLAIKLRDAERRSSGRIFLPHSYTHNGFL